MALRYTTEKQCGCPSTVCAVHCLHIPHIGVHHRRRELTESIVKKEEKKNQVSHLALAELYLVYHKLQTEVALGQTMLPLGFYYYSYVKCFTREKTQSPGIIFHL